MVELNKAIEKLGSHIENWMWAVVEYRLKTKDKSSNLNEIEARLNDMLYCVQRCTLAIDKYINECPEVNTNKFTELILKDIKEK